VSIDNIPQKYRDMLVNMMEEDSAAFHFLWSCKENKVIAVGKRIVPENTADPLDYIMQNGLVEDSSLPAFSVFCAQVEQAVIAGTADNSTDTDVMLMLPDSEGYTLCRFYALYLKDEKGRVSGVHVNIRPYTSKEIFSKQVLDYFTSDKAPALFSNRIKELMDSRPESGFAFIQFDVERFKLINDNYGVEAGDGLLKFIKDSLDVLCSLDQPFCRLTADVFMIVTEYDTKEELVRFVRMLESRLGGYMDMDYRLIFGIALVEDRKLHTRRHGDNAALARQSIKGNALQNIAFYNSGMRNKLHKKHDIEDDMHDALLNHEFVMYLQPKHCISSGRIIGAEALARWEHPEKGMISPAEFIPIFEQNGFILKLDSFIWEEACHKIRDWIDGGIEPVPISVNVSREYLHSFDVVGKAGELVRKYDIPISLLQLEITETTDGSRVDDVVRAMKDAGFTTLMDDFGSGYSSLNTLKTSQFDVLKIDRGFLSEFMESSRGRKIISHTISMSRDIGLDIIAEGVETPEQAEFLKNCGCDAAQGFFYSKPISVEEFDRRLVEVNMRQAEA